MSSRPSATNVSGQETRSSPAVYVTIVNTWAMPPVTVSTSLDVRCARVGDARAEDEPESRQVFIQSGELGEIIPRLEDLAGRIVQFLKGDAVAAGPREAGVAGPADSAAVGALERRVEALERAVFESGASEGGESVSGEE